MQIIHTMQREDHHCAVASIVMVTGAPYEVVLETMDVLDDFDGYGMSNAELASWLTGWFREADPGNPPWKYKRLHPYRAWSEYDLATWPRAPHVVSIRERTKGPCHVVVVHNARVFDPEMKHPRGLASYERIGFRLIGVVGIPGVLQAAQEPPFREAP
ncbi:MAG: hypothetical protein P4L85_02705 [Paludisphaera borealis]|uniref:hypothetical protein n=1 Tax=Paludisphaera borealis TaxID=1387353 RepID=UPI00283D6C6E|nr:hypothetical protein [Paludisphaera borealis]MDR3618232.1 hypothetical protein [Paludisphaera borealis]